MAIARVQSKTANSGASGVTTLAVVLDSNPTAGNIVVAAVAGLANSENIQMVQGSGIMWLGYADLGASSTGLLIAVGRVLTGASATITATAFSSGGMAIAVAEYSGAAIQAELTARATSTGTSAASGATGTTGSANELWIGGIAHRVTSGATFSSPTNGFSIVGQDKTSIGTTSDRSICLLEKIVSSTGTADAGATISASGVWIARVMTFDETAGGGGGGPIIGSGNLIAA